MAPKKIEKNKNQHIQVVVRVRPLSSSEKQQGSHNAVEALTDKREIHIKQHAFAGPVNHNKTFTFDRVFGPQAKQLELYQTTVVPIIEEVLLGYNCTIFAYGQTGSGKTFTMEGERSEGIEISMENDPLSGIIPRTMGQLFSRLEAMECEFSVRVSYLEIYNEELNDLLGADSVDNPRLKIYEDNAKKGSCVIQGLEDIPINNRYEIYKLMERGSQKRQTAATQMNTHSSRSHSVFMVTIHMRENSIDGEELLKTGKLNMVDLAGSECIGRSGAIDKRAREAGNINQSLLTLGRVITALVEHAPHIPYRESKLTRLLQDSLGGRTKTSIIATISPASANIEETLSTLDYANRAKNITNKPEINQKLTKKAIIKEYTEEIEQLRKDLQATRDKSGVYIAQDNYNRMQTQIMQQRDSIKEFEDRIALLNSEMYKLTELFTSTKNLLDDKSQELEVTSKTLEVTEDTLKKTCGKLRHRTQERDEQSHLVVEHVKTETKLYGQASQLLYVADEATSDVSGLHNKLDRVKAVEQHNELSQETFLQSYQEHINTMKKDVQNHMENSQTNLSSVKDNLGNLVSKQTGEVRKLSGDVAGMITMLTSQLTSLDQSQNRFLEHDKDWTNNMLSYCRHSREAEVGRQGNFHDEIFLTMMSSICSNLHKMEKDLNAFSAEIEQQIQRQQEGLSSFVTRQLAHFDNQRELVTSYSTKQTALLQGHIDSVKENCVSQIQYDQTCVNELMEGINKLMTEMTSKRKRKVESSSELCDDIALTIRNTEEYAKEAHSVCNTMTDQATSCKQQFESQCTKNNKQSQLTIQQIEKNRSQINNTAAELEKEYKQFSKTTSQVSGSTLDQMVTLMGQHQEATESHLSVHKASSTSLCQELTGSMKNLDATRTNQHTDLSEFIQSQQVLLNQYSTEVSDWSGDHHTRLEDRGQDVESFLLQEMKKVQPTGTTPQAKPFSFPRRLAKTYPHSGILETFRKDYLMEEAINTPLPDNSMISEVNTVMSSLRFDEEEKEESENNSISGDSAISTVSVVSSTDPMDKCEMKENMSKVSTPLQGKQSSTGFRQPASKSSSTPYKDSPSSHGSRLPLRTSNH